MIRRNVAISFDLFSCETYAEDANKMNALAFVTTFEIRMI